MDKKLFASCNLASIPFLGHTDTTRLQMSSKQLKQALTNLRCEVPKVIGSNFRYLVNESSLFRMIAPEDGIITYSNEDIMILLFKRSGEVLTYDVPLILPCSSTYSTTLRYKRDVGEFSTGDIIYEYDSFTEGIPTYGYNTWTAYMPFFGLNHEDAIVVSESFAERARSVESETIIIPIYSYSLFKKIYNSESGFIPDIGQAINGNIVAYKSTPQSNKDIVYRLKSMNLSDFSTVLNNELQFTTKPITSKINNGVIASIRVHAVSKEPLIDKTIDIAVNKMYSEYYHKFRRSFNNIQELHGSYALDVITKHYILVRTSLNRLKYNLKNLAFIIELKIAGESGTKVGDKIANRYAHKGVISTILPDELRPIALKSQKPIDSIVGPVSVISRMNLGQVIEGNVAKVVQKSEEEILRNPKLASEVLSRLSLFAKTLGDKEYSDKIFGLSQDMCKDQILHEQFIASIRNLGLYFEGQNFANFEEKEFRTVIKDVFDIDITEPVLLKKELLQYMKDKVGVNIPTPTQDVVLDKIYAAPIYTLKLKQKAASRISCRDFGSYKMTNRQPVQGRGRDGNIGQGSRLGHMELT